MTFTQNLYEQVCDALPNTTARRFSRLCGKSEGYYGSICAQQMEASTDSLIYLAEMIEHLSSAKHGYDSTTKTKLLQVQQVIANEIAQRTQCIEVSNLPVRKMIISALAGIAYQRDHQHNMPAIIMG